MIKQQTVPDYRRLSQTPKDKTDRKLKQQIQMGSTINILLKGHRPAIPMLQSDRRYFPSKQTSEKVHS